MTDLAVPATPGGTTPALPVPRRSRWQPLRVGLVDLFYYDCEEFWFRDGRLMLLGNNGTGKSKVLALTLPFLLDADLSPARVEPDGDIGKRMEWNLLLGGRYDERLGYTWLEFGRHAQDGENAYFTVGCGLKAVAGRGVADRWYFTSSQRVGVDLYLIGPGGTALTRDRLTTAVGEYGTVTQRADSYRRTVDEHLLHLGPDRYAALVDLLVQLRQPQLSKRPDEARLSRALSQALPPVDQSVLADIAAAFHDLEQQRDELAALKDTRGHVTRFGSRYRHYARVAARRQARALRTAQYAYEQVGRALGDVSEQITAARGSESEAGERLDAVRAERTELSAAREELAGRPELASLQHVERHAEATARTAVREAEKRNTAEGARRDRAVAHDAALVAAGQTGRLVDDAAAATERAAAAAGVAAGHGELVASLNLPDGISEPAVGAAGPRFDELAARRERAVGHVLALADAAAAAEADAVTARARLTEMETERDGAAEELRAAADAAAAAGVDLVAAWQSYAAGTGELAVPHPDETGLAQWATTLDGPNPAETALRQAQTRATRALAAEYARAANRVEETVEALTVLEDERRRLEAGETASPPVPHTRGAGVRDGRSGAPLWRLTDFADGVDERQRAGLEAALEAAGLLDAWLLPDGALVDPDTHDVLVDPGQSGAPAPGGRPAPVAERPADGDPRSLPAAGGPRPLSTVLRPAIDPADADQITPEVVDALLAAVAATSAGDEPGRPDPDRADPNPADSSRAGSSLTISELADPGRVPVWVSDGGRWRVGPLRGAWAKPAAEYVGAGTRERARRRRLAELADEIVAAGQAVTAARQAVASVAARQTALDTEVAAHPTDQELRDAHGRAAGARDGLARATVRVDSQRETTVAAQRRAADAAAERDEAAADLGVPNDRERLRAAAAAVRTYADAAQKLTTELWKHHARLTEATTCADEVARAETELAATREAAAAAEETARDAAARLDAVRESMGATADEIRDRLETVARRLRSLIDGERRLDAAHREHAEQRAKLEGRAEQLLADQAAEQQRRDAVVAAFWSFAATGLLAVATPGMEIAADARTAAVPTRAAPTGADSAPVEPAAPAVRLARQVEQDLADVDDGDEAWRRAQDDIGRRHRELAEALSRHGHHAALDLVDERVVVTIQFQGRDRAPDELTRLLDDEIAYRERMLTARERELIEEHLVNDVASHLQELIGDAEAQVQHMNEELAERPTSTGMRLRLRWEPAPDAPPGLEQARRRLLRQDAGLWSPADRAALGEFLQRQIEAQRTADEDGTWHEHLRLALDYRGWHRFAIERFSDGRWRPAAGPASGGERVLTVSLPLFAAASAHYRSAHRDAPRLVLLDEAFAGVDDDARAKCLGLLTTFDLDVVMTSEREWGFYATVPGIATHHLVRRDGIDAVHVTSWEWDGHLPRRVDRATTGVAALAGDPNGNPNGAGGTEPNTPLW